MNFYVFRFYVCENKNQTENFSPLKTWNLKPTMRHWASGDETFPVCCVEVSTERKLNPISWIVNCVWHFISMMRVDCSKLETPIHHSQERFSIVSSCLISIDNDQLVPAGLTHSQPIDFHEFSTNLCGGWQNNTQTRNWNRNPFQIFAQTLTFSRHTSYHSNVKRMEISPHLSQ